eukprot:Hpha_TRINITY_DN14113_c0_g1::TRINITY_DN14113_c0_g1_i1::g.10720::m.10720
MARRQGTVQCRRPRWVPDSYAPQCKSCDTEFSLLRRRHHCRRCGNIFCSECTKQRVTLPFEMGYGTAPQRICQSCTPNLPLPRRPDPITSIPDICIPTSFPAAQRSPIYSPVPILRKQGFNSGRTTPNSAKRSPKVCVSPVLHPVGFQPQPGSPGGVRVLPWTPDQSPRFIGNPPIAGGGVAAGRADVEESERGDVAEVVEAEEAAGRGVIEREWMEGVWSVQGAATRHLLESSKKQVAEYRAAQLAAGAPSLSVFGPTPTNSPQSQCPLSQVGGLGASPTASGPRAGGLTASSSVRAPSITTSQTASPVAQKGRLSATSSVGPSVNTGTSRPGSVRGRVTSNSSSRSGYSNATRSSSSSQRQANPPVRRR